MKKKAKRESRVINYKILKLPLPCLSTFMKLSVLVYIMIHSRCEVRLILMKYTRIR
jgi:hypothetical protein